MAVARFHSPLIQPGETVLSEEEAAHAAGARRLRTGEAVELFDGRGNIGEGEILRIDRRAVVVAVRTLRTLPCPLPPVTVFTAVPKGKRLPFMIEKLTELGVSRIQPLHFTRSVAEGGDPVSKWPRWALEAAKQAHNPWLPEILPALTFAEFADALADLPPSARKTIFLADAQGESPFSALAVAREAPACESATASANETNTEDRRERADGADMPGLACVIGPEGGLSPEEFARCEELGLRRLRLGGNILRIETAALAFCAMARI